MQFSLIPYSLLCYLFGLTQVSLMQFAIGILGMLLPNLFWAYVGSLLQNISEITGDYLVFIDSDPENSDSMATKVERFTFMCLGFAIAIYGLYKVSQSAKESVRQQMNMNESSTHVKQQHYIYGNHLYLQNRSYDEMNEFEINHENPEEDIVDRDFSLVAATLAYSREIRSNTQQRCIKLFTYTISIFKYWQILNDILREKEKEAGVIFKMKRNQDSNRETQKLVYSRIKNTEAEMTSVLIEIDQVSFDKEKNKYLCFQNDK